MKLLRRQFIIAAALLFCGSAAVFAQPSWQSQLVYYDGNGKLQYQVDSLGNRIPDFSYAGFRNSSEPIPDVPVEITIAPVSGDNTSHIQNAINTLAAMPLQGNGFRGALLLEPGEYPVSSILRLNSDGIVLRGSGDGDDPASNSIIRATGNFPVQRDLIIAGGGAETLWADSLAGTRRNIVSDSVLIGDYSFEVSDASPYSVGDNIIIHHPCSETWLAAIDSGGTFSGEPGSTEEDIPWEVDSQPLVFNRYITAIEGNVLTIDAPLYNPLVRSLSQSYVYTYARTGLKKHIGIENLRIDIETQGGTDENHAWNGIYLQLVEDAWVRNCTILHFGLSGVYTNTATRITVQNCRALDPVSVIEGGKRYNFNAYNGSQFILFRDCHASNGRHSYMSNGTSYTSGIVFLDCTSAGAYAASEGHRRWTQGMLYDNFVELNGPRPGVNPRLIGLYNRGYFGTSHGWSAAHSVAWACNVNGGEIHVQQPPTAQNYAIGCFGIVTGHRPPCSFDVPEGFIEGSNTPNLNPRSLFLAQLENRGIVVGIAPVAGAGNIVADGFELLPNYPNPFNPATSIRFVLPEARTIKLAVYNNRGQRVMVLREGKHDAGAYVTSWDAAALSSGIYLVSLLVEGRWVATQKALLLK